MANKQMIKFRWRSGSGIRIRIHIATLVRHALAEVCTAQVLLVGHDFALTKRNTTLVLSRDQLRYNTRMSLTRTLRKQWW